MGIPGVNSTGAGDHIPKLDTQVRRLKELVRSVVAGLHFKVPANLVQDLVSYAVNRINTRRSSGDVSAVCPRVKLTGKKVNYKREFTLSFGDYVECYDPSSRGNTTKERTNSCIALYPCGNITGSWHFLNLLTGRRVRRSRWVRMRHTPDVIKERLAGLTSTPCVGGVSENQDNREEVSENEEKHEVVTDNEEKHEVVTDETRREDMTENDSDRDEIRRSHRLKLKAQRIMRRKGAEAFALSNISVSKAIKYDPKRAAEAIHQELEQMLKGKKVFAPIMRRDVKGQVIRSHMFLKYKYDAQGRLEKLKARLVADGRTQDREQYPNNYSPTVSLEAIMSTLKLAAISRKSLAKFDIKGAYLNADLDEELYLELDPTITRLAVSRFPELAEFVEAGRLTVRLDKALYGLVQCARLWFENISSFLKNIGFTQNPFDECVFTIKNNLIVILYVDDLLASSVNLDEIRWLESKLKSRYDEVDSTYGKK